MKENEKGQEPQQQPQNDIDSNRNTTLQDPGAAVADYGRSGTMGSPEEPGEAGRKGAAATGSDGANGNP